MIITHRPGRSAQAGCGDKKNMRNMQNMLNVQNNNFCKGKTFQLCKPMTFLLPSPPPPVEGPIQARTLRELEDFDPSPAPARHSQTLVPPLLSGVPFP